MKYVVSGLSRTVAVAVLVAGALLAAQQPCIAPGRMGALRRRSGRHEVLGADRHQPQNVQRLHVAWEWKHWETPLQEFGTTPGFFETTPLMIDGVLYVTTPYNSIAALDAETGRELWRFDGEAYKLGQILSGAAGSCAGPRSGATATSSACS